MQIFKKRTTLRIFLLAALLSVSGILVLVLWKQNLTFPVREGSADLQNVQFYSGRSLMLKGEWEYFDKKWIITDGRRDAKPDGLVTVPSYYTKGPFAMSWGSYRVTLLNCPLGMSLSVTLKGLPAVYRIYINGQCVEKSGEMEDGSMLIEAGSYRISLKRLYAPICEIVVETAGMGLSGLSVAPIVMEERISEQQYQRYQAVVFLLLGVSLLFAISYGTNLIVTPRGEYTVSVLIALFLIAGLTEDPVYSTLFSGFPLQYDTVLVWDYLGRLCAWFILLRGGYRKKARISLKSGFSAALLTAVLLCMAAMAGGVYAGTTLWCLSADFLFFLLLVWRLVRFARLHSKQEPEAALLEAALILLWMGYALGDLAMSGMAPYWYSLFVYAGAASYSSLQYILDRRQIRRIQSRALEAAKMEQELERARTELALHQIQPHFLHNTLMSIKTLCRKDPGMAERAVLDFAVFLRGNMNAIASRDLIPFSDERKTIEAYLHIEHLRFGKRLQVVWKTEETNFRIPPLSIQPLVENAVRHGICKKLEGGTVTIATFRREDRIVVEILDDGVGYDVEREPEGIGIGSLRLRLQTSLGASLTIIGARGEGCRQTIEIPVQQEENREKQ